MTRDELLKHHELICKSAQDLMNLKNRDYAGNGGKEPFANFTRCESLGVCTTEQGMLVRVVDKISRLSSFVEAGKMSVENESFHDSCIDIINYMVILSAYITERDGEEQQYGC